MALLPYTLMEPPGSFSPLLVDSPHSGRIYPVDFAYSCPLALLRQAEDAYVDELILGALEAGASIVTAEFPRSMIDVNRAEDDIDPSAIDGLWPKPLAPDEMTLSGFGLVRRLCRNGISLYRAPLTMAEIERRLVIYYRPYHECLRREIQKRLDTFSNCYFLDMHSMPDRTDNGIARPDFILGDRDGTSCDQTFTRRAQKILQDMGYRVTLNSPYKGREIVQRYGRTGQGAQALQIEINRKLYLEEATIEKNSRFNYLRNDLTSFYQSLATFIERETTERLAAE